MEAIRGWRGGGRGVSAGRYDQRVLNSVTQEQKQHSRALSYTANTSNYTLLKDT